MGLGIRAYDNGLMVHKMEFWDLSGEHGMEGVFLDGLDALALAGTGAYDIQARVLVFSLALRIHRFLGT